MQSDKPKAYQLSADDVALACINKYLELPKTGKPIPTEWSVLSGVVQYDIDNTKLQVVSIGTGSKCIGAQKMSPKGDILNDSHAEVIARRGFLLYLYDNIHRCHNEKPSIFKYENGKFHLKESISFAFYSSQLPCGDATIHLKTDSELIGDVLQSSQKRNMQDDEVCKIAKTENAIDVHRTGAKCVKDAIQDTHKPGSLYHVVGQVRTKPGRGDPTLSVSCSDKMARWVHVGIQGALLDMLLDQPIYISSFIFGAETPYSEQSLKRALLERNKCECPHLPTITETSVCFSNCKSDSNLKPAAGSILWVNTATPIFEVAVLGKKLGVTKKARNSLSSQLSITKYCLYKHFIEILKSESIRSSILGNRELIVPYNEMKELSTRYKTLWNKVKEEFFKTWTRKPDMWKFTIEL